MQCPPDPARRWGTPRRPAAVPQSTSDSAPPQSREGRRTPGHNTAHSDHRPLHAAPGDAPRSAFESGRGRNAALSQRQTSESKAATVALIGRAGFRSKGPLWTFLGQAPDRAGYRRPAEPPRARVATFQSVRRSNRQEDGFPGSPGPQPRAAAATPPQPPSFSAIQVAMAGKTSVPHAPERRTRQNSWNRASSTSTHS